MRFTAALVVTLVAASAGAHVAPSLDDNNRYLKLTPLADRVRLAYTVFFGEVPGAQLRPSIDADRDGAISDAEAQRFGDQLAAEVAAGLTASVDGADHRIGWSQVVVGTGTPRTRGGALSVDLIAYLCVTPPRGRHEVRLRDRFRIPRPGETEVRIEDSPGIAIARARVGRADNPSRDYRFVGPGGPLADDGIELVFTAGAGAPIPEPACAAATGAPARELPIALVAGAIAAAIALTAATSAMWRYRARRRRAGRSAR